MDKKVASVSYKGRKKLLAIKSITSPLGVSAEMHEEARKKGPAYRKVVEQYAATGVVKESRKPALIAVRDGLEKEMRRGWQRVRIQIGRIAELVKVWVAEATIKIASDESGEKAQYQAKCLRLETLGILMGVSSGYCRLEHLPQRSLFPELAEVQEKGIRQHLKKVEPVIEEMRPIERRLFACERVLYAALRDKEVPGWEEVKQELQQQQSGEPDARVKHAENKTWVIALLEERVGEYEKQGKLISSVASEYGKQFGKEISSRQIRRYWKEHLNGA